MKKNTWGDGNGEETWNWWERKQEGIEMVWWKTKDMRNREIEDRIKNGNDDMTLRCNTKNN